MVTGGCLCGDIRYSIVGQPLAQLYCYCIDCTKISGTDGYAAYVVQRSDLTLEKGNVSSYSVTAKSGRTNTRNFCSNCGSRLWADLDTGVASVAGGSLDDFKNFQPTMVHCEDDAPNWARVPSGLASLPSS
jgi:hypothetical protein